MKTYIVKLAHWQDLAYARRTKQALPKAKAIAELVKSPWMGRSVSALFMVNKELSGLAATHLFEVRILFCVRGRRLLTPRAGRWREQLHQADLQVFIDSSHSRHFRKIVLSGAVTTEALVWTNAVASFRTLACRIKHVSLVNFSAPLPTTMLSYFPAAQTLRFP